MLSGRKLQQCRKARGLSVTELAEAIDRAGLEGDKARAAIGNWEQDRLTPAPDTKRPPHLCPRPHWPGYPQSRIHPQEDRRGGSCDVVNVSHRAFEVFRTQPDVVRHSLRILGSPRARQ